MRPVETHTEVEEERRPFGAQREGEMRPLETHSEDEAERRSLGAQREGERRPLGGLTVFTCH